MYRYGRLVIPVRMTFCTSDRAGAGAVAAVVVGTVIDDETAAENAKNKRNGNETAIWVKHTCTIGVHCTSCTIFQYFKRPINISVDAKEGACCP